MAWAMRSFFRRKAIATEATKPVGTSIQIRELVKGDHVELAKFDGYWGAPAKLDKVTFKFISDPSAAFAAVMAAMSMLSPCFLRRKRSSSSRATRDFR